MKPEDFAKLDTGDVVRHVSGANGYVVCANFGPHMGVTLVRTVQATNPREWQLLRKGVRTEPRG